MALAFVLSLSLSPAALTWAEGLDGTDTAQTGGQAGDVGGQTGGTLDGEGITEGGSDTANLDGEDGAGGGAPADAGEDEGGGAAPADNSEVLPDLKLEVTVASDGTPDWDADDAAGNDSGPNNGIVRVNDTVTYLVEYVVTNTEAENLTWTITFPKGMELTEIPGYCRAGSSLDPLTAGEPTIPLTADSINQLSEQTLTCNMGTREVATDKVFVTVKVLNLAHQGQDLALQAATITADGIEAPVAATPPLPSVKASARLMWDISKNSVSLEPNSGGIDGPRIQACDDDSTRACMMTVYPVLFSAPTGGKGAMPAIGDVTFVDDLRPEAMYPQLTPAQHGAMNADLAKYGSVIRAYASAMSGAPPGDSASRYGGDTSRSVRDSGTITAVQPGPGEPAAITVSGADWSLRTYPTRNAANTVALPGNAAYAISGRVAVFTPVDTIRDFGVQVGSVTTLRTYNGLTDLDIRGYNPVSDRQGSGDQPGEYVTPPMDAAGPVHWNDFRTTTPNISGPGSMSKLFVGIPGTENNPPARGWGGNVYQGLPGGASARSGSITVAPTQPVISFISLSGSSSAAPAEVAWAVCDAWDNTKLHLRAADYPAATAANGGGSGQFVGSEGVAAVWISGYTNVPNTPLVTKVATSKAEVPALQVQYAGETVGGSGDASTCPDNAGPWYDDPADVPGNEAALAAAGVYTAVTRVRAHVVLPKPNAMSQPLSGSSANNMRLFVSIGMQVADKGWETGTYLPNWASSMRVVGDDPTMAEMLASGEWSPSRYDPNGHTGAPGDRLILAHAQARIDKQVRRGDSGAFSDTPPQVTGGDLVQYRLAPSLTSGAAARGILKDVWVEDCLPASQFYDSASLTPAVVSEPGGDCCMSR